MAVHINGLHGLPEGYLTVAEYARSRGVSSEAVRRQLNTEAYREALEGHVSKSQKSWIIDAEAAAFLDTKRMPKTVIQVSTDEEAQKELDRRQAEIDQLRREIAEQKAVYLTRINEYLEKLAAVQEEKVALLSTAARVEALTEERDESRQLLESVSNRLTEAQGELYRKTEEVTQRQEELIRKDQTIEELSKSVDGMKEELGSFRKTWFGLYKKV